MSNMLQLKIDGQRPVRGGYAYFWQTILQKTSAERPDFTYADVDGECNFGHEDMLVRFLRFLVRNGFIEVIKQPARIGQPKLYRVVKRQSATPKFTRDGKPGKKGTAQQQLWNAIRRAHQGFNCAELALAASTDEVPVAFQTARDYCRVLAKAGLLRELAFNKGQNTGKSYVLLGSANTGPKAPVRYQTTFLFDPNTGLVLGDATATEVDP